MPHITQSSREKSIQYGNRDYQEYAKRINDSRGTGPGYPHAFRYHPATWGAKNNQTREFINPANHETARIQQINRSNSMIGHYDAMVPDLPFNEYQEKRKHQALNHVGMSTIATGAAFVM